MQVAINHGHCILCGVCETYAPEVFRQRGRVEIDYDGLAKSPPDPVLLAVEACPMACIEVLLNP